MKFPTYTDEQLETLNLPPEGWYRFQVREAVNYSKEGRESLKLKVFLMGVDHEWSGEKFDFLTGGFAKKLKHFCITTDNLAAYDKGELTASLCLNKSGFALIKHKRDQKGELRGNIEDYALVVPELPIDGPSDITDQQFAF